MDDVQTEIEMLVAAYDSQVTVNDNNDTIIKINNVNNTNIRITLPKLYPKEPIKISSLETAMLNQKNQLKLLIVLREKAIERSKEEMLCCFEIIQDIIDYIEDNKDNTIVTNDNNNDINDDNDNRLSITFIYFHHIKSNNKKKVIVDSASELELGGVWKEGFPGVVLCEGIHGNVLDFISRLKRLRWQQMTVKGIWFVDNKRSFMKFTELDNLSTLSQICNQHNLNDIYRSSMGLSS